MGAPGGIFIGVEQPPKNKVHFPFHFIELKIPLTFFF